MLSPIWFYQQLFYGFTHSFISAKAFHKSTFKWVKSYNQQFFSVISVTVSNGQFHYDLTVIFYLSRFMLTEHWVLKIKHGHNF